MMKAEMTSHPTRKISETFLSFAAPLLEVAGEKADNAMIEKALHIAFTIWNSVVFDTCNGNSYYVDWLRELIPDDRLVEEMIERKNNMFSDDQRLIGNYKVTKKNGEWNLWAEARKPTILDKERTSQTKA